MKNKIISIQSKVVYGYLGGNIAELAIQRYGLDIISFPSVLFAAHTGHKPTRGKAISKKLFDELVIGLEEINVIKDVSCIITGYIGSEDILVSSSNLIQRIKNKCPDTIYICDPVMGDVGTGLYVPDSVAQKLITTLIPYCDILTPNHFELEYILKQKINRVTDLVDLVKMNPLLNTKTLIVTSCNLEDTPKEEIETIIIEDGEAERIYSKKINLDTVGTGDLFASILASQLTLGNDIILATTTASNIVGNALAYTVKNGLEEMNAECLLECVNP